MIAQIFDKDGKYLRTTEGSESQVLLNVPEGGSHKVIEQYVPPVHEPDPDPQLDLFA